MSIYNEHLIEGYRLNYNTEMLFRSSCQIHNETVNIWTHLLPCIGFIILFFNLIIQKTQSNVTKIPIYIFLFSAIFQLLLSTTMHMFTNLNKKTSDFLMRLDIAAISILMFGNGIAYFYYALYCNPEI
jgi:adiponectin receptor